MEMPISSDLEYLERTLSSHHYDAHDVAIVLNNTGVTLLQNSCYLLAAESFRDALHVVKLATADRAHQEVDLNVELSNKMANASKRLTECHRMQLSESNSNLSHNLSIINYDGTIASLSNAAINTDVFDDEKILLHGILGTGEQNNESQKQYSDSMKQRIAIRIIDHHLRCPKIEIDTAIILYNYGIAFPYFLHCKSFLMKAKDQEINDVMNNSRRLFMLSHDVLSHLSFDNDSDNNNDEQLIIILLSCLVTMALFKNAMDTDTPDEAFHYYRFIRFLRYQYQIINSKHDDIVVFHLLDEFIGGQHAAAA